MAVKMRTDGNDNILWGEPHIEPIIQTNKNNESKKLHDWIALKASKWIMGTCNCSVGAVNYSGSGIEVCDGYLVNYRGTYLVEAKVSLIDFKKDAKKIFRINPEIGVGKYRFYACPKGLLKLEDLPEKWGLIEVNEKGHCRLSFKTMFKEDGTEIAKHNKIWVFERDNAFNVDWHREYQYLYYLAKRYATRQFMNNML